MKSLFKRFAADEKGTAYIMAAFAVVPLFGMTGLAVDYANAVRTETQIETAAQSVALHLAKRTTLNPNIPAEDLIAEGKGLMAEMVKGRTLSYDVFQVDPSNGLVRIVAKTTMDTYLMHMFGTDELTVVGRKQAQFGRRSVEVAIAIDNSGSMDWFAGGTRKMDAAKTAAGVLIDAATAAVEDYANSDLKFSVIPWHTHVSVPDEYLGGSDHDADWIDWEGRSTGHFRYLPPYKRNGSNAGDMKWQMPRRESHWGSPQSRELVYYDPNRLTEVLPLEADGDGVDIDQLTSNGDTVVVTRKDVFDAFTNVTWNGCFEHRAGDYRYSFDAPNNNDGDSLFVPHLAPDEYDRDGGGDGWQGSYRNDYVDDVGGDTDYDADYLSTSNHDADFTFDDIIRARTFNTAKYAVSGNTTGNWHPWGYWTGPNGRCNTAKLRGLTDNRTVIDQAIDGMDANGGTDLSIGLSWAMNTLTPWEPLTAAADFGEAEKILVFMTDGDNSAVYPDEYMTSMSSLGYLKDDPMREGWGDNPSKAQADAVLDDVSKEYCTAIKNLGVKIYFVYFGTPSANATGVMNHCATSDETAIAASNEEELVAAFREIGDDIGKLRLSHYTPPED